MLQQQTKKEPILARPVKFSESAYYTLRTLHDPAQEVILKYLGRGRFLMVAGDRGGEAIFSLESLSRKDKLWLLRVIDNLERLNNPLYQHCVLVAK